MLYGVETQTIPPKPPSPYAAQAVHFANQGTGSTVLHCSSLAATNNGFTSFSMWSKGFNASGNTGASMFVADSPSTYTPVFWTSSTNIRFTAGSGAGQFQLQWIGPTTTAWHHYLGSFDTNHVMGSKIAILYIDDVLVSLDANSDGQGAYNTLYNGLGFWFGGDSFGAFDGPTMDVADVWIAPGVALHSGSTIPQATRRQFINADLTPVNPNTFPASAISFHGDASSFATNHGTGGSFSLTGTLTNASTHP